MLVLLPGAKAVQFRYAPHAEALRQLVLVGGVGGIVLLLHRSGSATAAARKPGAATGQSALPRGVQMCLAIGSVIGSLGLAAASVVAVLSRAADVTVRVLCVGALVLLVALVVMGCKGGRSTGRLVWVVGPAIVWLAAIMLIGGSIAGGFDPQAGSGGQFLVSGGAGRVVAKVLIFGVGEEVLYRGLLPKLVQGSRWGVVAMSLSFGAWHIPDAWGASLRVVATVFAMATVSLLVLYPLRKRAQTVVAPMLLHAANNVALSLLA